MILRTFFTEVSVGDDVILIGDQLLKGNVAQGGPITLHGIRTLRVPPEFALSLELNLQSLWL